MGLVRRLQTPVVLSVCLVTGLTLFRPATAQGQERENSRLTREARELFKAVERGPSSRCKFDQSWDSRPVLAETARNYLKLRVQADLVVSEPPATPMQIIDPAGREADAFCSSADRNAAWQALIAALPAGDDKVLRVTSVSYGFPVFNADFTRAAVIVQSFSETWRRTGDGPPRRTIEASGGAEIFARRAGIWKRIDYDVYFTAH